MVSMMSLARPAVDATNKSLGYNYTADQVKSALLATRGVARTMYFRYNLLDSSNNVKKQLTTVLGGSVSYDYTQQIKRTATFNLKEDPDINYLQDRIKPFALLKMPDGNFAQFPLGVFLLSTAPQQTDESLVVTRSVTGYDFNQILSDWKTTDRYTIASGTNYIEAVRTLLNNAGITSTNLTSTTLTTPTALDYPGGTSYLDIINGTNAVTSATSVLGQTAGLLKQINYRSLWFDEDGTAVADPWLNPANRPSDFTIVDDSNSVISPVLNRNIDLFAVPNVWVVVVAQTDQATLSSKYTNSNAASPTSTTSRGRQIVHFEQNLNAPTSQTLDSFAQQLAFEDSQVYETIAYETAILPVFQDYDIINLQFSALGVSDNYSLQSWSFPFQAGAFMQSTIRKIVPV